MISLIVVYKNYFLRSRSMDLKMPDISIKRTVSNGKVYEMVEREEYLQNPDIYLDRNDVGVVIRPKEYDGQELVVPLRRMKGTDNPISPGVYHMGPIDYTVVPDKTVYKNYIPDQVVEIRTGMDAREILESGEAISRLDEPFITTPDSITRINISPDDDPEMRILKEALNEKNIDLDKYAGRFGKNFPNDKRQLKGGSITLNIIKRFCNNMDMEAILTLKDRNEDVPNPIGKELSISLTDSFIDDSDDEIVDNIDDYE